MYRSTIRDTLIPHAVSWFTGEAGEDEFGDLEDDDEDEDEDDDEEDDEDEDGKKVITYNIDMHIICSRQSFDLLISIFLIFFLYLSICSHLLYTAARCVICL